MTSAVKQKPHQAPFFVRQAGLDYGPEKGAILGYDNEAAANEDCADRNGRAAAQGFSARYEVVKNS